MARKGKPLVAETTGVELHPWWWRTRYKMAPVYAIVSVILFGLLSKLWESAAQILIFLSIVVTFLVIVIKARYSKGKHKDPGMALFLYVCTGLYLGAILAIRFDLLPVGWLLITLAVAFALLSLFWWFDRKNLHTQQVEEEMRRWPELAKKIGLEKVRRGAMRATDSGRKVRLWWNPGDATLDGVQSHARQLESVLGIPVKRIRFQPVMDDDGMIQPNMLDVSENTKARSLKEPIPFGEPTMKTIYDKMFIGPLEDGEDYDVTWYDRKWGGKHTLAGGETGSGKSGLYDLFLGESSKCLDLVRWGIDRKGGMTLKPWATLFDWLVFDEAGTESMLVAIRAVLEARSNFAGDRGWKTWRASAKRPLIVIVIDECAEVLGSNGSGWQNSDLANSIARMGRAAGVLLLLATQHPTTEALSSTQLTKNLGRRFCFAVADSGAQRAILPNSLGVVDATTIPTGPKHAGTFYTSEGGVLNTLSGRVRFVAEEVVRSLLIEIGDGVSSIDQLSADAAAKATQKFKEHAYELRKVWLLEDLPALDADDDADEDEEPDDDDDDPTVVPMTKSAPTVAADHVPVMSDMPPDGPVGDGTDDEEGISPEDDIPYPTSGPEGDTSVPLSVLADGAGSQQAEIDRAIATWLVDHRESDISQERADNLLDAALDASGPEGISPTDLRSIVGRGKTVIYEMLDQRMKRQPATVEKLGRGRYRRPLVYRPPFRTDNTA